VLNVLVDDWHFTAQTRRTRPIAETVFACLFGATALFTTFNEGFHNWQSLWTAAAYFLLCNTLWQARTVAVAGLPSTIPAIVSGVDLFGNEKLWRSIRSASFEAQSRGSRPE